MCHPFVFKDNLHPFVSSQHIPLTSTSSHPIALVSSSPETYRKGANNMAALLSLPTELLCCIADHATAHDLCNLRLVCKQLSNAAEKPYAIAHFAERQLLLSVSSIRTLLNITAHPVFGPYVRSITLALAKPVSALNDGTKCSRLMKRAFETIKKHQKSISVGLRSDVHPMSLEIGYFRYSEALKNVLVAADLAECPIHHISLSMHHHKFYLLNDVLKEHLKRTEAPLKLHVHCSQKRSRALRSPYTFFYDQQEGSLRLLNCDLNELAAASQGSTIKTTLASLIRRDTTQLILDHCHIHYPSELRSLLRWGKDTLNSICFRHVTLGTPPHKESRSREDWSGVLTLLSDHTALQRVVIGDFVRPDDSALFQLPHGTKKYEAEGDDLTARLKSMATLMVSGLEDEDEDENEDDAEDEEEGEDEDDDDDDE